jgi:hypothetical protein
MDIKTMCDGGTRRVNKTLMVKILIVPHKKKNR